METIHYEIAQLVPYISWSYFFHAWGFEHRYITITTVHDCAACKHAWLEQFTTEQHPKARQAMQLHDDAMAMLGEWQGQYRAHVRFDLCEAHASGDDLILHSSDRVGEWRLPCLRQQSVSKAGDPCLCLADFVRPLDKGPDKVGLFISTIDAALEQLYSSHSTDSDDYKHLLAQTLADRLAEAATERMHHEVRTHYWGYAPHEKLTMQEMLQEKFQGIRPAVGYPSLPDQSIIFLLARALHFDTLGVQLTENGAMRPHASVSGLMMAHPAARYFAVGPIDMIQVADYARRRGITLEEARKYLAANIVV